MTTLVGEWHSFKRSLANAFVIIVALPLPLA
jgi:hypothetical protein